MTWTLSINLETEPDALRVARRMIYATVKQEGLSDEKARELQLATGEALSNARAHAYGDGVGPVTVDLASQTEAFVVAIHNAGKPVAPPTVPTTLASYPAGMGLYLIAALVDDVQIKTNGKGQGLSITMTKKR
ncbi:MAG TPA: ATP-binding protein [bacterium]|nr:ATP-binding protein [bacterium]